MKYLAIAFIKIYQWCIAPLIAPSCRFAPSCSNYAIEAFQKHGFLRGILLTFNRLRKCHPWNPGGIDNVP